MRNPIRYLYDWVLGWAETRFGERALFWLAFAESSFFPIPPDVLQIALSVARPVRSFWYAAISSVGSVLGGCAGYLIGLGLFHIIALPVIKFYNQMDNFVYLSAIYNANTFGLVALAGFTPIPYKLFTIAAGVCQVDFTIFLLASALSRSARFFIVAVILYFVGPRAKNFINRYFNLLTIIFGILVILGVIAIEWLWK